MLRRLPRFFALVLLGSVGLVACGNRVLHTEQKTGEREDPHGDTARGDLLEQLNALPGVEAVEVASTTEGVRLFNLSISQPVDHDDPSEARPVFRQHLRLLHRGADKPLVLATTGYHLGSSRDNEVSRALGANKLEVEQRFFGRSAPELIPWDKLTIAQAAADHHRIVETFKALYPEPWLSTGISKGGMTSVYHRRFYPDDVAGTIAYVAPQSYGTADERYPAFLETVGTAECRSKLVAFQREALRRRDELLPIFEAKANEQFFAFDLVGGLDTALEFSIQELRFAFWQYGYIRACAELPGEGASAEAIAKVIDLWAGPAEIASDESLADYAAFYHQIANELGYYGPLEQHLDDLLRYKGAYVSAKLAPEETQFNAAAMPAVQRWVSASGERIIFVYGEYDPWTAGAFALGGAKDSALFTVPAGNHGANVAQLDAAEIAQVNEMVSRWAGSEARFAPRPTREAEEAPERPRHERFRLFR